jgi:hypothetical protein
MMTFTTRAAGNSVAYNWLAVARHYLGGHRGDHCPGHRRRRCRCCAQLELARGRRRRTRTVERAALSRDVWTWPVHEPIGRPLLRERVIAATSGICAATNHAAGHEPNGPRYCAAWSCRLRS